MIPREVVMLTRYVKACCPQQQIDEYTPDAWQDLLGDLELTDCREAVKTIVGRQPFVAPSEIRAEVRRIRDERLNAGPIPAPATDDPAEYIRQLKATTRRIADGTMTPLAITAGGGDESWDNSTVRRIREMFDAEQAKVRAQKAAEQRAAREATRAYIDAQEVLIGLDDLGTAATTRAWLELFGPEQAAAGFPLAADVIGVTDQQKTTIRAAEVVRDE
jgi:hypothetical protein